MVVSGRGGFAARTPHDTPIDPETLALWHSHVAAGRYGEAERINRDGAVTAPSEAARVCHIKDLAIISRLTGDLRGALNIHTALNLVADRFDGPFRGRIENGFARSLQTVGDYDFALKRYTGAREYAAGDLILCAQIDTNTGRCYTSAGQPENSHQYFERALKVARQSADSHLEGEILESAALALEMEGKVEEAEEYAHKSVTLISATGDRTALDESVRTWLRLKEKLSEGVR